MKLLFVDFESTWTKPVDPEQALITEIGAVLFDWSSKKPLSIYSELVYSEDHPKSPPELVELTGITDAMLEDYGVPVGMALYKLLNLIERADFIVAHNGTGFDKPLLKAECGRHGMPFPETPWIDTRTDIPFPKRIGARKLSYLAAEHGFLNPFAHRAVFDCLTTAEVLKPYDILEVIELSKQPLIHAVAKVSYQDRALAKEAGYYWDGEKKNWFRPMKESLFEAEKERVPFLIDCVYTEGA